MGNCGAGEDEGSVMSMASCIHCGHFVDTDNEPEFYDFNYKTISGYGGHCENCRDEIYEAMTEAEQAAHEKKIYG